MSDYIEREDAYREIMECFKNSEMPEEWENGMHSAGMIILQDVPSADVVEVRHGHWKVVNDSYGGKAYICECSECEDTVWVYKDSDRKWNYCPNCGARMDGDEQENG